MITRDDLPARCEIFHNQNDIFDKYCHISDIII